MSQPKWMPAGVGAEPKKVGALVLLVIVLGVVYYTNSGVDLPPEAIATQAASTGVNTATTNLPGGVAPPVAPQRIVRQAPKQTSRIARRSTGENFQPTLLLDNSIDVSQIDPTLKLEVLEQVRSVGNVGGRRSLFEFYDPPPPPPPPVKNIEVAEVDRTPPPPPKPQPPPPPPPPPPIPLKFYGVAGGSQAVRRHAFFLDGEDIFVAAEGDVVQDRYRIVRIGVNSAEVEDIVATNTQTLPIVEQLGP